MKKIIIALVALLAIGGAFYIVNLQGGTVQKEEIGEPSVEFNGTAGPSDPKTEISLNLPTGWSVYERTESKIILNGSYLNSTTKAATYVTLYVFDKNKSESLQSWIDKNKSMFYENNALDMQCVLEGSNLNSDVYECSQPTQYLFLVNKTGNKVVTNFGGQDPAINANQLLNLVSFK